MSDVVLLCVDGSELSLKAVVAGAALLRPGVVPVVVTVVEPADPMLVTGTGMAGGTMSPEEYDLLNAARMDEGQAVVDEAVAALGLAGAETLVLEGAAGPAVCDLAEERSAAAVVLGSRGRSGFRRALLGSVSDHVVRNAPCPVVVTHPSG